MKDIKVKTRETIRKRASEKKRQLNTKIGETARAGKELERDRV